MTYLAGIFLILHGAVHLFFVGQALRLFELGDRMTWPDNSWFVSRVLGRDSGRRLAAGLCLIAAAGFTIAGVGLMADGSWWEATAITSAVFSSVVFVLLWNTSSPRRAEQGGVALLINAAILVGAFVLR